MKDSRCTLCVKVGYESWICFSRADVDVRDLGQRLKWCRDHADEQYLRGIKPHSLSLRAHKKMQRRGRDPAELRKSRRRFLRRDDRVDGPVAEDYQSYSGS